MPLNLNYYYPLDQGVGQPSIQDGLVAHAGGGQALATPLPAGLNIVITVGSAADSVVLPAASDPGNMVIVVNEAAANSMNIYPLGASDTINALSATTAIACAANKTMLFYNTRPGRWHSVLTA